MNEEWKKLVVTKVTLAMRVPALGGKDFHQNRPMHGLILNEEIASKDYIFSDGRVLHTKGNELFYLPKGSTYQVKTYEGGGCYAINFDAELSDEPFLMHLRDVEGVRKIFHGAAKRWKAHDLMREMIAMRALYEIVLAAVAEQERDYQSSANVEKLAPAMAVIESRFTDNALSVAELSSLCGMSEVYFRRLFEGRFGISPKEYLIRMRIEYAKSLLASEQFTVGEVAELCGYAEPCHFSREFSKRVGVSPNQYTK